MGHGNGSSDYNIGESSYLGGDDSYGDPPTTVKTQSSNYQYNWNNSTKEKWTMRTLATQNSKEHNCKGVLEIGNSGSFGFRAPVPGYRMDQMDGYTRTSVFVLVWSGPKQTRLFSSFAAAGKFLTRSPANHWVTNNSFRRDVALNNSERKGM